MEIQEKLETQPKKTWWQLTPEQTKWIAITAILIGVGIIAKGLWMIQPGITTGFIELVIFASIIICYVRLTASTPVLHKYLKWVTLIFVGGFLNFTVTLANGGFMPTSYTIVLPAYIPMEGSSLAYLGDWLWLGTSPGDVLMIVAFVGVIATLIHSRENKLKEKTNG